ncbi:DNA primase [Rhodobacterales bacterium FZCC0069]|nr:DNA primase [Rhodobacterales bacterium FZCC0069]
MADISKLLMQLQAESEAAAQKAEVMQMATGSDHEYADFGGALHYLKTTKGNQVTPVRLCHFSAEIVREVMKSDGLQTTRHFEIVGLLPTGEPLPTIEVAASDFDCLDWVVSSWGSKARIAVIPRAKDHVAAAIKERSEPEVIQIHQHSGWVNLDGKLTFLSSTGGIGLNGLDPQALCELPGPLRDVALPDPIDPQSLDVDSVLENLAGLIKNDLALLLFGAVARAPLCHFKPATCSVFLQGTTGSFKSAMAGVLQAFFGSKFDGAHLPANWSSTGNSLEKLCFLAKDIAIVIDDWVPRGNRQEVAKGHANAERVFRGAANQAGRGRMNSKGDLQNAFVPRGVIISTGEDVPNGHSLQARLVIVNIARGAVDRSVLTNLQNLARNGVLAQIMSCFIHWLANEGREDRVRDMVEICLECDRENVGSAGHTRTQDNLANLLAGLRVFCDFAVDQCNLDLERSKLFLDKATNAAQALLQLQASIDKESSDAQRFVDLVRAAIANGRAHVEDAVGGMPRNARALGWRAIDTGKGVRTDPMGARIGWIDKNNLYLDPNASLAVVKALASDLDNHIGVSERSIAKSLREAGLLDRCDKGRNTLKVSVGGARRSVYSFRLPDVVEIDTWDEPEEPYYQADIPF